MAKAMEALPIAEAEARNLNVRLEAALKHNEGLELNILTYKEEIERLNARCHDLEVARDDAELRFLEADDSILIAVRAMRQIMEEAEGAIAIIQPPKAQPEPIPEPISIPITEGQAAPKAFTEGMDQDAKAERMDHTQGQSEPDLTHGDTNTTALTQENGFGTNSDKASTSIEAEPPPSDPYSGRSYASYPAFVSRWDWVNGGGDATDYDNYYANSRFSA